MASSSSPAHAQQVRSCLRKGRRRGRSEQSSSRVRGTPQHLFRMILQASAYTSVALAAILALLGRGIAAALVTSWNTSTDLGRGQCCRDTESYTTYNVGFALCHYACLPVYNFLRLRSNWNWKSSILPSLVPDPRTRLVSTESLLDLLTS